MTNDDGHHLRPRLATSTPYSLVHKHAPCNMSTLRLPHPVCLETPAAPVHCTTQKGRPRSTTMTFSSSYWVIVWTRRPEYRLPGPDSTAERDTIMRTQTPTLTLSWSYAYWDIHRAHRSSVRNLSASHSSGDSPTLN